MLNTTQRYILRSASSTSQLMESSQSSWATKTERLWIVAKGNLHRNQKSVKGYCTLSQAEGKRRQCLATPDCSPLGSKLLMELSCLHNANEHEHKATPSAEDLDQPSFCLHWEGCQLSTSAIWRIPERISTSMAFSGHFTTPRRIRAARCWTILRRNAHIFTWSTTQLEWSNSQDHHWLHIGQYCRDESPQYWGIFIPTGTSSGGLATPINKLNQVKHDGHHQCNLESVEKIHPARSSTTIHDTGSNIQNGRNDHRPTSCTHQSGDGQ